MIIGFLRENDEFENRSMLLPEHVSLLIKLGFKVLISNEYGEKLNLPLRGNAKTKCKHTNQVYELKYKTIPSKPKSFICCVLLFM